MLEDVVKNNKEKLHELAEQNTKRDENGISILAKDDVWLEDEESFNNLLDLINDPQELSEEVKNNFEQYIYFTIKTTPTKEGFTLSHKTEEME